METTTQETNTMKIWNKTIQHGPNYLSIDGTTDTGTVRVTAERCEPDTVSITAAAYTTVPTHTDWVEIRLSPEDAIRLANDILNKAGK